MVDVIPVEGYSQVCSDSIYMAWFQLPSFETSILVVR